MTVPIHRRAAEPVLLPSLRGRRVELEPVDATHFDALRRLYAVPHSGRRALLHQAAHSEQAFTQLVRRFAPVQFAVTTPDEPRTPRGHVFVAGLELQDLHADVEFSVDAWHLSRDAVAEMLTLTTDYSFSIWPLRKLYCLLSPSDVLAFEREDLARPHSTEGRLADYAHLSGTLVDVEVLAIYRSDALAQRPMTP